MSYPSTYDKAKLKNKGAILPGGKLNVSLIQREVSNDISSDNRYYAEDGMKKRAIHMSKDYEEFKNFVACSELNPVKRSEMSKLFQKEAFSLTSNRPQNKACTEYGFDNGVALLVGLDTDSSIKNIMIRQDGFQSSRVSQSATRRESPPNTVMELEKEWRLNCRTSHETSRYLLAPAGSCVPVEKSSDDDSKAFLVVPQVLRILPKDICSNVCKAEMNADIFGGIIQALDLILFGSDINQQPKRFALGPEIEIPLEVQRFVHIWMAELTLSGGFALNIEFLTSSQKQCVRSILDSLERLSHNIQPHSVSSCTTKLRHLLSEEGVKRLRQLYKIT